MTAPPTKPRGIALELSHGAFRPTTRADLVPALPTALTEADRDPLTKRFVVGNRAAAGRELRKAAREQALLGLDPAKVDPWMAPYVGHAQTYAARLVAALPHQAPGLTALAGDAATAAAVYRGLLSLGVAGDKDALRESRAWLREHRQSLATLSALAGVATAQHPGDLVDPLLVEDGDA